MKSILYIFLSLFYISAFSQNPYVGAVTSSPRNISVGQTSTISWNLGNSSTTPLPDDGTRFIITFPASVTVDQSSLSFGVQSGQTNPFSASWNDVGGVTYLIISTTGVIPGAVPFQSPPLNVFDMTVSVTGNTVASNSKFSSSAVPDGANDDTTDDSGSGEITVTSALPINLLSFDAVAQGRDAVVTWETATEINNEKFVLEYSVDGGETFDLASEIDGAGTTTQSQSYAYTHVDIASHQTSGVYYRLTQVDYDGQSETFPVRYVNFGNEAGNNILHPNPVFVGQAMTLTATAKSGKYKIIDQRGALVKNARFEGSVSTVPTTDLVPGYYNLVINGSESLPFIILK